MNLVLSRSDCSHEYFTHATNGDGNCLCVYPGLDCSNAANLVAQSVSRVYQIITPATSAKYDFASSGRCEDHGWHTITSVRGCEDAARSLGYLQQDKDKSVQYSTLHNRAHGCTWHHYGNVEYWDNNEYDLPCKHNGYSGCLCVK